MPYTKINSRWIKDLNISCDTIKVLEEKTQAGKSQTFHVAIFSPICPLEQGTQKKKINKWDLIKIKSFCMAKENSIKMKREPTAWENIFAKDTSDKGLSSEIYKEFT